MALISKATGMVSGNNRNDCQAQLRVLEAVWMAPFCVIANS